MRVLILKRTPKGIGDFYWDKGLNMTVTVPFGNQLVRDKRAAEIPEIIGSEWYLQGRKSSKLHSLRKVPAQGFVTIEEYEETIKKVKDKKLWQPVQE